MIAITAENTKNLPTTVTPKPQTWDKRGRAQAAAVKTIGPHAREGFEFETFKCDGRWGYRLTDGTRPENHAQLKANGGKKSILAQAVAIEAKGGTAPKEMLEKAFDEVAGKITAKDAVAAAVDAGLTPKQFRAVAENVADQIAGQAVARAALDHTPNKNGVPKFLERAPVTKEQQEATIAKHKRTTGPDRQIKNPPNVKAAKKRAAKEKGKGVGFTAREAILAGKTNEEALAVVMKAHPTCGSNVGCMSWYRNDLRKKGLLKDGKQPKARPTKAKGKK